MIGRSLNRLLGLRVLDHGNGWVEARMPSWFDEWTAVRFVKLLAIRHQRRSGRQAYACYQMSTRRFWVWDDRGASVVTLKGFKVRP